MYSANSALHYLFAGRFQQCKEPICLALNQENPNCCSLSEEELQPCILFIFPFPWETKDGQHTESSPKPLLPLVWSVGCLLPPAKNIWRRKEVFQHPEPTERSGFSLTQQIWKRQTQFSPEATTVVPYHWGGCCLLPWISTFSYQDKHLEIFFFTVEHLEVSQKENHLYSWILCVLTTK